MVNSINTELLSEPSISYINGTHGEGADISFDALTNLEIDSIVPEMIAIDGLSPHMGPLFIETQAERFPHHPNWEIMAADPVSYNKKIIGNYTRNEMATKVETSRMGEYSAGAALMMAGLVMYTAHKVAKDNQETIQLSRRKLLGLAAGAAGSFALGTFMTGKLSLSLNTLNQTANAKSFAQKENLTRLARMADSFAYPVIQSMRWWVDGRTATIIDKVKDYQNTQGHPCRGAVLMGTLHGLTGPDYLENAALRNQDIRTYIEQSLYGLELYTDESGQDFTQSAHTLINYIASYSVNTTQNFKVEDTKEYIDEKILDIGMNVLEDY